MQRPHPTGAQLRGGRRGLLPPSRRASGPSAGRPVPAKGPLQKLPSIFPKVDTMPLAESGLGDFQDRTHCVPRMGDGHARGPRAACSPGSGS